MNTEKKKHKLRLALFTAEKKHVEAYNKLHSFELEQSAKSGQKIYQIPVMYSVEATVTVYADNIEEAFNAADNLITPPGEYVDGTWELNVNNLKEEKLLVGVVK